jgi:hypothetical protein
MAHSTSGRSTPEYQAYQDAQGRCNNSSNPGWKDYGGRGIKFLFESFEQFLAHAGPRPSSAFNLDRVDNNGNYEVSNVHWVSKAESAHNRRSTKLNATKVAEIRSRYAAGGVTLASLAMEYGVDPSTIGGVVRGETWTNLPPKKPSTSVTSIVAVSVTEKVG